MVGDDLKKNLFYWQFAGFAFSSFFGTLLHYLYEWTGQSIFVAPFSGVNESTWEHMKLLYFPLVVFALVQSFHFREYPNYWCVKLWGVMTGLLSIPVLFYTINGMFGKTPAWVNIAIFFVSAFFSYLVESIIFLHGERAGRWKTIAFSVIAIIGVLFVVFTFSPPEIPIFLDPVTGTYGVG